MIVTLDSSIIYNNYWFSSKSFQYFLKSVKKLKASLCLVQLVVEETETKFVERLMDDVKKLNTATRSMGVLFDRRIEQPVSNKEVDVLIAQYPTLLREILKQNDIEILSYDFLTHNPTIQRSLRRRRPFDNEGHKGYRDAVIWETLVKCAVDKGDSIIFINNNTKDFADKEGKLHEHLKEDLINAGLKGDEIIIVDSLDTFNERYIPTQQRIDLEYLDTAAREGKVLGQDIKKLIIDGLFTEFVDLFDSGSVNLKSHSNMRIRPDKLNDVVRVVYEDAKQNDSTIALTLEIELKIGFISLDKLVGDEYPSVDFILNTLLYSDTIKNTHEWKISKIVEIVEGYKQAQNGYHQAYP